MRLRIKNLGIFGQNPLKHIQVKTKSAKIVFLMISKLPTRLPLVDPVSGHYEGFQKWTSGIKICSFLVINLLFDFK